MNINIGIPIDLEKLISSRLLIQAGSGGGKSYALRKLVEAVGDQCQQIILDLEGEFVTLREKYPFALIAKNGDIPLSLKYAETLAHKLLETRLSAIIDLYELKQHERILFVKRFLDALMNAPKELWHSCLIYVDEAHHFCPETSKSESMSAVIDLCTRGRKRGFAAVLATQRLSKLHKDAAAECQNKLIGLCGLDNDQKRAADELGMNQKEAIPILRDLQPGEFYAFGPAISSSIQKFKVSKVNTTHLKPGAHAVAAPPTPNAIKKILSKLRDIPEEAEKELASKQQLQAEVAKLRGELTRASKSNGFDPAVVVTLKDQVKEANAKIQTLNRYIREYESRIEKAHKLLTFDRPVAEESIVPIVAPVIEKTVQRIYDKPAAPVTSGSGAMRMLKAAAMFHPKPITKTRMAALARMSHTSGSFATYIASLRKEGLITGDGKNFEITGEGLSKAGPVDDLPTDPRILVEMWCDIIGGQSGGARILRSLANVYPQSLSKEDVGGQVEMSHTSGSFATYLSTLKRNGLITANGGQLKASDELFI